MRKHANNRAHRPAAGPVLVLAGALLGGCTTPAPAPDPGAMEAAAAARSPMTGVVAPDFTLPDAEGRPVSLASLRGKWVVLYFYPQDDTPGCTCQATEFTKLLGRFAASGAEILGISPDAPEAHRAFARKYGIGLRLLSDADHAVMARYGAWVEMRNAMVPYHRVVRSTFLVGPEGTIRYHWPEVIPEGHAERVRRKLAELRQAAP